MEKYNCTMYAMKFYMALELWPGYTNAELQAFSECCLVKRVIFYCKLFYRQGKLDTPTQPETSNHDVAQTLLALKPKSNHEFLLG